MSDQPESGPGDRPLRSISRLAVIAALFLGLHILPLFWPSNPLWGVDFLFYLPAPIQGAFFLLSILLFIPGFRRQVRAKVCCLPLAIWGDDRRVWFTRILILLIALAAFISLSSARHFLGDGYHVLEKLDAEDWHDKYRAPLTYTLVETLHRLGSTVWTTAENTYRLYSYISGTLYVLLCFPVAAALGKNALEKSIVLVFLLTAGYIQQFFGYVENYALYLPVLLFYLVLGQRTLEERVPLFAPALVMGVMLALHPSLAVFGPSLLYLAYLDYRHVRRSIQPWKNLANILAALCCIPLTTAAFLRICGIGFEAYLTGMSGGDVLPVFAEPGYYAQYRIFSVEHLVDFINLQLLSAPAACMAVFLWRMRPLSRHTFLAICTLVPLFFTFIAKANIGAFRDWDILSLPALPLTLWAATMLLERIRDGEKLFHCAFVICGAAALHTFLWIGVNAGAEPAEARFTRQLDRLSGHARTSGWITLAKFHRQQENPSAALEAYKRALDADPTNPNRWITVGIVYRGIGRPATAVEYFEKAVELQPDHPVPYMNLGEAYNDMRQFNKAIEYIRKALTLKSNSAAAHQNLGVLYTKTGQFDKAVEHLNRASTLQPKDARTHELLAETYQDAGKNEEAIHHLERAISLRPRQFRTLVNLAIAYSDVGRNGPAIELLEAAVALQPEFATVHLNLGVVYIRIGQYETAIQCLNKALEIEPDNPHASTNLGIAYKAQGRYVEAIEQFEKTLELQGENANAMIYLNIGDTYQEMGDHKKAITFFQMAIQLAPNQANPHLLLGMAHRVLKRNDRARVHFEKTLELEPNHPQAAQIRKWLEQIRE